VQRRLEIASSARAPNRFDIAGMSKPISREWARTFSPAASSAFWLSQTATVTSGVSALLKLRQSRR